MTFEQLKQRALAEWETQGKAFPLSDLVISDTHSGEGTCVALRHMGKINPDSIYAYIACDGYAGLSKALSMTGEDVIGEVAAARLRGRGGAGFHAADKMTYCRNASGNDKILLVNASEGDPSARKDRCLLETDPHSVLEGALIAGYAAGASRAYICIHPDFSLAADRLTAAIARMTDENLLGDNILGSGFSFHMELKPGQGSFIQGEESALISTLEGDPACSSSRPPYPAVRGFHGIPTLVFNVETLSHISAILTCGAAWYTAIGTGKGTKLLTIGSGFARTGVVEVPLGTSLRTIVYNIGGLPEGKALKAVQVGGPTGAFLTDAQLDTPLDFEELAKIGTILGSGTLTAVSTERCAVDMAKECLHYLQLESCGKCVFGREGTRQLSEILNDIARGAGKATDLKLLQDLGNGMKLGALCGLCRTAPNPMLSTLTAFREEYEAHIHQKACPAKVCEKLTK